MSSFLIRRANVVYSGGGLPSEYTELAYLEGSGTQYIDTGISNQATFEVVCKYMFTTNTSYEAVLGCVGASPRPGMRLYKLSGSTRVQLGKDITLAGVSSNTYYTTHIIYDGTTATIWNEGSSANTATGCNVSASGTILLFTSRVEGGTSGTMIGRITSFYYKSGSFEMNLVPAKRNADSVVGMYDLISNTFLTNAGSGSFSYGEL